VVVFTKRETVVQTVSGLKAGQLGPAATRNLLTVLEKISMMRGFTG
jgi:hypothetical protein